MILVTGATGSIGRHLVRCLRQRRVPFLALVRSQEKAFITANVTAMEAALGGRPHGR